MATAEDLTAEERWAGETAREFVARDVLPQLEAMERHDWDVARRLLLRAGELGLLGAEVPETYGGLGLRKLATVPITAAVASEGSFAVTFGAHTGIGMLPLVYFGTVEQKRRYLPAMVEGRRIGAYSLTEPGAGSDALSVRTAAYRQPDGSYILRGSKQWTSNGGFADLFVVYAKVDEKEFSAFLVEGQAPGLRTGPEERKMGLHASSTVAVHLEGVRVPAENVLHRVGKGHQVAFNILNLGRFKLGAGCVGAIRHLLAVAASYAQQRQQFGRPIASFPLIQAKLAHMAIAAYALESVAYRVAGMLDEATAGLDLAGAVGDAAAQSLSECAIECSIVKVFGTEALDAAVDEAVQVHGGYGYMRGYEVERAYRDSRINRIFEGTNEINRLLIAGSLLRRAAAEAQEVLPALRSAGAELLFRTVPDGWDGVLAREAWLAETARLLTLMVAAALADRDPQAIEGEQEVLAMLADLAIQVFMAQSCVARASRRVGEFGPEGAEAHVELAAAAVEGAFWQVERTARTALARLAVGDELRARLSLLRKLARLDPLDTVGLKRQIAARVLASGGYPLP